MKFLPLALLLLSCTSLPGCFLGFGSTHVGEWAARDEVVSRVCVEDAAANCVQVADVVEHIPARTYYGVAMTVAMGSAYREFDGDTSAAFRMEPGLELTRGHGRWGRSYRLSGVLDISSTEKTSFVAPMLSALQHYAIAPRANVYLGAGVAPYATYGSAAVDPSDSYDSHVVLRGLGGIRYVFARSSETTRAALHFEVDGMFSKFESKPFRSIGATFSLAFHM